MKWLKSGIFSVLFISTIGAVPVPFADEPARLPKTTFPVSYDLAIRTDIHNGESAFTGTVRIEIGVATETNRITLHNREITIDVVRFYDQSGSLTANSFTSDPESEFLHIDTAIQLLPGQFYSVEIDYSSQLNSMPVGFYRSSYRGPGNVIRYYTLLSCYL